jgi:hypothetical protein
VAGQKKHRRSVRNQHGARDAAREASHQPRRRAVIDHAWADKHCLRAVGKLSNFLSGARGDVAAFRFGQREDAGFGHLRRDELRDAAGCGYAKLPRPGSERGGCREYRRARHLPRAAHDEHASAIFFIILFVGLWQRPPVEKA